MTAVDEPAGWSGDASDDLSPGEPVPSEVSGWGRQHPVRAGVTTPFSTSQLRSQNLPDGVVARGLGRSYGDAAQLEDGTIVLTERCDAVEWVDRDTGIVRAESGATIGDLIAIYAPKGWFVPVSPGTRRVTVGGAVAADIHGKNHHVHGSFGSHVRRLTLRMADDSIVELSPQLRPELFWATVGGMGLTGIIVDADIALTRVPSTRVRVETQRFGELDAVLKELRRSDELHEFSVAWVDLLAGGRGVVTQGSFADPAELAPDAAGPLQRPWTPSVSVPGLPQMRMVRTPLMRAFNEAWFRRAPADQVVSHESITAFFHPLDALANWNRFYGPAGFLQWQCVVPSDDVLREICARFASAPSFLTVLKRFGPANPSPLSFPRPGWTLAVDLPVTNAVLRLLDELDRLVIDDGGRLYLAKDSRMSPATLRATYPRLDEWLSIRRSVDPTLRFRSDLSERLGL